jgi:hypothetical protein
MIKFFTSFLCTMCSDKKKESLQPGIQFPTTMERTAPTTFPWDSLSAPPLRLRSDYLLDLMSYK